MARLTALLLSLLLAACGGLSTAPERLTPTTPAVAAWVDSGDYDANLCVVAQRIVAGAGESEFDVETEFVAGSRFTRYQMYADPERRLVHVPTMLEKVRMGRKQRTVDVYCKLLDQERINDVLGLRLPATDASCRQVNEFTHEVALASLTAAERARYLSTGRQLRFVDDYPAVAGAEWYPAVITEFITPVADAPAPGAVAVQAPAVRIPWDPVQRDWFTGSHLCKLISLEAMRLWMTDVAFRGTSEMFPSPKPRCFAPTAMTSEAGSCVFYFGPARRNFCQDYSGPGWDEESARADCGKRHVTKASWDASKGRHTDEGGSFSTQSCKDRNALAEVQGEPWNLADARNLGTCVFHCKAEDEALWHTLRADPGDDRGVNVDRICDLYIPAAENGL